MVTIFAGMASLESPMSHGGGDRKGEKGPGGEGGFRKGVLSRGARKGRCYMQEGDHWACQQQQAF